MADRNAHRATLTGTDIAFDTAPDQSLLMAGLAAGLALPYECCSGTCGSCKAELKNGEVQSRFPDSPALSPRDRRKGRILLCQCEPRGDVELKVRLGESVEPPPRALSLRVDALERLGASMLLVRSVASAPVEFLAGQYVLANIPGAGRRAYSMANAPDGTGRLEFLIKAKPGGAATAFLFDRLRAGDTLDAEGPFGRAYLRPPDAGTIRCLAGGSGLAPVLSITRDALRRGHAVELFYGARSRDELVLTDEIEALRVAHPRLRLVPCLSEPAPGDAWDGAVGNVGDVMFGAVEQLAGTPLYMAGPAPMVDAVLRGCVVDRGVPADQVFFDRFF